MQVLILSNKVEDDFIWDDMFYQYYLEYYHISCAALQQEIQSSIDQRE